MLGFRTEMLDPARNTIGKISVALADVMNDQHNAGMDLNGDMGGDFFSVGRRRRACRMPTTLALPVRPSRAPARAR